MSRYTPDALEAAVLDALQICLPEYATPTSRIIFANQDGPRPSGTFLTLYVTGGVDVGRGEEAMGDVADGAGLYPYTRRVQRESTVSVQAFGPDAWAAIQRLQARMQHPSLTWQIQALGLCFVPPFSATRLGLALGPQTENRAVLTVTVRSLRDETVQDRDLQVVAITPTLDTDTMPVRTIPLTGTP